MALQHVISPCPPASGMGNLLSIDDACRIAADYATPRHRVETVRLTAALGRTLAHDALAVHPCPPFAQSAMDGYAVFAGAALPPGTVLAVEGRVAAGQHAAPLRLGAAARIFTGAPIPAGADTIVMQERTQRVGDTIVLRDTVRPGEHVRREAEDVCPGSTLAEAGQHLDARHVALFAAQGLAAVKVRSRLRIAVVSTGDEIRDGGGPAGGLASGICDSNRPMLLALVAQAGQEAVDGGGVPDDPARLANVLRALSASCDLIVTTGGVSVGEEDHSASALTRAGGTGETLRIALKPGKPALVGRIGGAAYLGLPGNPVSALVSWSLLGRSMLAALEGCRFRRPRGVRVPLANPVLRKAGRTEFMPARLVERGDEVLLQVLGSTSARLRPLVDADGFVELPADLHSAPAGSALPFLPFERLFGA